MKKRIKLFLAAAIAAIVSVAAGFYSYNATQEKLLAQEQELDMMIVENVTALTESTKWISNLRWEQCVISSSGTSFSLIGGIARYLGFDCSYSSGTIVYGQKQSCLREFTTNECDLSQETPCRRIN